MISQGGKGKGYLPSPHFLLWENIFPPSLAAKQKQKIRPCAGNPSDLVPCHVTVRESCPRSRIGGRTPVPIIFLGTIVCFGKGILGHRRAHRPENSGGDNIKFMLAPQSVFQNLGAIFLYLIAGPGSPPLLGSPGVPPLQRRRPPSHSVSASSLDKLGTPSSAESSVMRSLQGGSPPAIRICCIIMRWIS